MPYNYFAEWFEYLNDDCDYRGWSQYFIEGLRAFKAGRRGVELGCGSGAFTRALYKEGYLMTGIDISPEMLSKAQELALSEGVKAEFILGDAKKLCLPFKADFILSPNDCFNYLKGEELPSAFRRVHSSLKAGGIFWFDVSSEYKFRNKIANNMLADDREEVTYLSFNTLYDNRVETDVTLFVKESGGLFRRYDEKHTQYIHKEETLLSLLGAAGFALLRVEGHRGEGKEKSDRLNFICKKI